MANVKSAERVLALLEHFDRVQKPQILRELVNALAMPQSSMTALLATLIELGYIYHDYRHHLYGPTRKVSQLGEWIPDAEVIDDPYIRILLKRLHESGETVIIAEPMGFYARYVKVIPAKGRPVVGSAQAGVLRPLFSTALGLALLSLRNPDDVPALIRDANRLRQRPSPPILLRDVRNRLRELMDSGFVVSRHSLVEGLGAVAMPLPYPVRGRDIAVGLGSPIDRLDRRLPLLISSLRDAISAWEGAVRAKD
jgi:IclR family transcriptional regulator, KDG regulon repressor